MVLAGQRHCPGTLEMFTEKRKVGGSTPPLTTSLETTYYVSDQRIRRLPSMGPCRPK
jgi:hypothetical protein